MRTLFLFPLFLAACSNLPTSPAYWDSNGSGGSGGSGVSASSGDATSGAAIYADNCASCHGASAQGGAGPALAGISDSAGVIDTILYGAGGMPGFSSSLSDQDVSDVLAYLADLGGGSGGGGGGGSGSGDGQSLFLSYCATCHGSSAQGGSGPALAGIAATSGVIDMILYGGDGMPGFADTLSDSDVDAILSWLGGLSGSGGGGGDDEGDEGEDD